MKAGDLFMNNLKLLREKTGLSMKKLADELKITDVVISRIENGQQSMGEQYARMFSDYFDVTVDYLLCRTDIEKIRTDKIIYREKDITYSSVISNLYKFSKEELLKISGAVDSMLERRSDEPINTQKDKNYLDKIANAKN